MYEIKEIFENDKKTGDKICSICGQKCKSIFTHYAKKVDEQHTKTIKNFNTQVEIIVKDTMETCLQIEIVNKLKELHPGVSDVSWANRVRGIIQETGFDHRKVVGQKRKGKNNPVFNDPNTRKKIAESVAQRWEEGQYDKRINGMKGAYGGDSPQYKKECHTFAFKGEYRFKEFLEKFQDVTTCADCGCSDKKMNIHHIDENHKNFLPSNLVPLCVPCHMKYHYRHQKQPYASIAKTFYFAGAHQLPYHKGLCQYQHGHEWRLDVEIRKRIDPKTGMVIDFKELKEIVCTHVISHLDHSILNESLFNPTAENLLVWVWERLMLEGLLKGINKISIWESKDSLAYITVPDMLSCFIKQNEENK